MSQCETCKSTDTVKLSKTQQKYFCLECRQIHHWTKQWETKFSQSSTLEEYIGKQKWWWSLDSQTREYYTWKEERRTDGDKKCSSCGDQCSAEHQYDARIYCATCI